MKPSLSLAAALLGLALGIHSTAVAQQTVRLTAATGIAPTVPTAWWFSEYIGPKLKEYSGGRIAPNVQINGTLCNEHKRTTVIRFLSGVVSSALSA